MSAKKCNCGDAEGHARAVQSAVFMCVVNAAQQNDRQQYWWDHADKLEAKFKTMHGKHYGDFIR